ncbi:hypothetical protein FOFC_00554 [Fusarium oxysporum]|nr:hypothetical protein FOFC_00554 [Fusarium oxysporum]
MSEPRKRQVMYERSKIQRVLYSKDEKFRDRTSV